MAHTGCQIYVENSPLKATSGRPPIKFRPPCNCGGCSKSGVLAMIWLGSVAFSILAPGALGVGNYHKRGTQPRV